MKKTDLDNFINKCMNWAIHFGIKNEKLDEFRGYLYSDSFFDEVLKHKSLANTQKQFNQDLTGLVFEKLKELIVEIEFDEELEQILKTNQISKINGKA